jgi:hypothetical protein
MTSGSEKKPTRAEKKAESDAVGASLRALGKIASTKLLDAVEPLDDVFRAWMWSFCSMKIAEVEKGRERVVPWLRVRSSMLNGLEVLTTRDAIPLIRKKLPPLRAGEWAVLVHDGSFRLNATGEASNAIVAYLVEPGSIRGAAIPYVMAQRREMTLMPERVLDVSSGEVIDVLRETQARADRAQLLLRRGQGISLRT